LKVVQKVRVTEIISKLRWETLLNGVKIYPKTYVP